MKIIDRQASAYYNELIQSLETYIGSSLLPGDERRIFADALSYCFMGEDAVFNEAFAQFSPLTATGTYLTALGARVGITRQTGQKAEITLVCLKRNTSDAFTIAAGTTFLCDGLNFESVGAATTTNGEAFFNLVIRSAGEGVENNAISASSTIVSADTNWQKVGEFFVAYLQLARPDDSEDDAFRVRVINAYTQSPLANTAKAWLNELLAFDPEIKDAEVTGNQGVVTVYPLALDSDGLNKIPGSTLLENLETYLNASERRPLGDTLVCIAPTAQAVTCAVKVDIPFASLSAATGKHDAYLLEICRRLSGNALADYSESVLIDVILDVVTEASDAHFTSDTTPGLNSDTPAKSNHLTGEVFVYSPANISLTFTGV